jgi:hypothetical protein
VDSVFSFLQFPKLKSDTALRDAISDGVTRSIFGYVPLASVDGDELAPSDRALVRTGKPTGPEEIDLGADAYLLAPGLAQALVPEPAQPPEPGPTPPPSPPPEVTTDSGRRLRVTFTAEKTEIFDVLKMLPTLADESERLQLTATIEAEAKERFDRSWVRNVVEEPLEEADTRDRQIELGD